MSKRLSAEEITAMTAKASHRVMAAKSPTEIHLTSVIQLAVDEVLYYDKNPRRHDNPKYEEIKESIRIRGLESALYVTKRPGSNQYMLARGGKTRLKALQELAKEDPQKWGKLDFYEIPWVSESDIFVAHMVENTKRKSMCFWDLAEAIETLRNQIESEIGNPVSDRSMPEQLSSRGIDVDRSTISAAKFALSFLGALGSWKPKLGISHIGSTIRPRFIQLQDLWFLEPPNDENGFKALVNQAVGECVAEHDEYSPESLVNAVVSATAKAMGVSTMGMLQAMHTHQASAIRTHEEFLAVTQSAYDQGGEASKEKGQAPAQQTLGGTGGDFSAPAAEPKTKPVLSDAARQNINRLMGSGSARATDVPGIPGVSVARGLTPRAPKSMPGVGGTDSIHGGPLTQAELVLLEKEGQRGLAHKVLWSELMEFGEVAGIGHLIQESVTPYLPYGFYVELPEPGHLGTSPDDIAVQAWWFLAAISAQGDGRLLPQLVGPDAPVCAFKQTGPGSFAHSMLEAEALADAVNTRLGGQEISGFDLLMVLITRREHPLHQHALAVLDALANWNAVLGSQS